jgi:hypothetical protein
LAPLHASQVGIEIGVEDEKLRAAEVQWNIERVFSSNPSAFPGGAAGFKQSALDLRSPPPLVALSLSAQEGMRDMQYCNNGVANEHCGMRPGLLKADEQQWSEQWAHPYQGWNADQ